MAVLKTAENLGGEEVVKWSDSHTLCSDGTHVTPFFLIFCVWTVQRI